VLLLWRLLGNSQVSLFAPDERSLKHAAAGGVAGVVGKSAVAPLSRVCILMQVQSMRPHKCPPLKRRKRLQGRKRKG
jgi:hypothetical protein